MFGSVATKLGGTLCDMEVDDFCDGTKIEWRICGACLRRAEESKGAKGGKMFVEWEWLFQKCCVCARKSKGERKEVCRSLKLLGVCGGV